MLDKAAIFKVDDIRIEQVEVPEWGGHVFVRTISAQDLDDYETENYQIDKGEVKLNRRNVRARLLVRAICDEDGKLLFTLKDVDALSKKAGPALNRIVEVVERLNGMSKKEDVEKNSVSGLGDSSVSPLPANSE